MAMKKSRATWVEREHPSATGLKVALGFKADEPDQDESGDTAESFDLPGDLEKEPTIPMVDLSFKGHCGDLAASSTPKAVRELETLTKQGARGRRCA